MIHLYVVLAVIKPAFICIVLHRRVIIREDEVCAPYCPIGRGSC